MSEDTRNADPWPTELRLNKDRTELAVTLESGERFSLAAEFLRVMSPSAEVRGHSPSERKLVTGRRMVRISRLEPVGNYAVRIVFSDGHDTGIYAWTYLCELSRTYDALWQSYLDELAEKGLTRG